MVVEARSDSDASREDAAMPYASPCKMPPARPWFVIDAVKAFPLATTAKCVDVWLMGLVTEDPSLAKVFRGAECGYRFAERASEQILVSVNSFRCSRGSRSDGSGIAMSVMIEGMIFSHCRSIGQSLAQSG